ncbi:hypothetical protein TNCV_4291501 [Trichonephila clavipes]|nr:hypothetical protein TNCV_4291501 [Trichonephila clavipes]
MTFKSCWIPTIRSRQLIELIEIDEQDIEEHESLDPVQSEDRMTSLKNAWNNLWPDLEGEKDFNGDHRGRLPTVSNRSQDFKNVMKMQKTWMPCNAEDCGFQMLNDDEIVTSVQEESGSVDDETDEDEDNNNNESSNSPSNADAFSALETAMEWYEQSSGVLLNYCCSRKSETLQKKNEGVQW